MKTSNCERFALNPWLLIVMVLFNWAFLPHTSNAQVSLNHSWQPSTSLTNPYGLTDLDQFGSGDYGYCKWGNLMDTGGSPSPGYLVHLFNFLTTGPYTYKNPDLFFSRSLSSLQLIALPVETWIAPKPWSPSDPSVKGGIVWLPQNGDESAALFRKLHFSNELKDEATNSRLDSSASKLIIVIHGWNRTSADPFTGEFANLKSALLPQLRLSEWKMVFYNWAEDADTGDAQIDATLAPDPVNPTKAAEIAHQHGQHLGELLAKTANLQKVHFIAHSAGTWAARAATKYLLQNTGAKVQITLLDPFVPGEMKTLRVTPNNTALQKSVIDAIPSIYPTDSGQLYYLENYYALDKLAQFTSDVAGWSIGSDTVYRATSQEFTWGTKGINQRVDWPIDQIDPTAPTDPNAPIFPYYKSHSGPVQFYADTVTYSKGSGIGAALNNPDFDLPTSGWRRSMFYQEPVITPLTPLLRTYSAGESVPLTAEVKIRGELGAALSDLTYQWEKKPPGGNWQSITGAGGTVAASRKSMYAIPSYIIPVTAGMDGTLFHLVVTNTAGTDVSNEISLSVGSPGSTIPAAPSGLTANAVLPNQINLTWTNNTTNATSVIIERKLGTGGTFAPIVTSPSVLPPTTRAYFDTGLTAGTLYFYRIIAGGSPYNSMPSSAASATTLPSTGTTKVLTVTSSNPTSGVRIILGPNDINGAADANTSFTRQYASNTEVTLIAPTTWGGAGFLKWQKDGQDWGTNTITSVLMDANHTLTLVYAAPTQSGTSYNIAVTAAPANGGTATGTGTYAANAATSLLATPAVGYQFVNWTLNTSAQNGGAVYSANASLSFAATSNLSLVANFSQNSVGSTITTTSSPSNGGTTSGAGVYQNGQVAAVSATPASGWEFGTWTDEYGAVVSFSSSFSYPVYQSHNYVANFNPILSQNYTLSMTASNGTAIRSPNQVAYTPGSQVTITATPVSGYLFAGWSGDASGTQNPLTVTMTGNKAVTANFSAIPPSTYTVSLPARTGGTVTKSPDLAFYSQGTVVTVTATPSSGYVFSSWRRDTFGTSNPLQITMDGNKNAVADFIPSSSSSAVLVIGTPTNLSLSATAGSGTLSVINQGSGIMYWSASPTVNWLQVNSLGSGGVTGGGGSNGLSYSWLDNPTTSPRSGEIRVYSPGAQQNPQIFTITQAAGTPSYALNVTADNGTVSKSPDQASYAPGTQVSLTATPLTGYQFTGWSGDVTSNQTTITVTMDGARNIVANFQLVPIADLYPSVSVAQAIAYAGTSYALTGTVGNRGFSPSNAFKTYAVFSSTNLSPPSTDLLNTTTPLNFAGMAAGGTASISSAVNVPGNFSPGTYYLWILVDPESVSGETTANRVNNTLVIPFTVLPAPTSTGPDLVLHDFSVNPSGTVAGGTVSINGRISNYGTAATTGCQYYISLSTSATIQPDKNALNAAGSLSALAVSLDGTVNQTIALPGNLSAGNYYLWIIADPENAAGEPVGNRSNNTLVLPLTLVQPLQTFTVLASSASSSAGSVSGGGTYASGAVVPLVATPNAGYAFVNWTEGGATASTAPSYVFTAIGDRTLVANFVLLTWVVTPSAGVNGTLSPTTPQTVVDGSSSSTFTATPNANYRVNAWSANGSVAQVGGKTFALSNVITNTAVSVTFKPSTLPAPGDLDPTFGSGGKVTTVFGTSDDYCQDVAVQADGKIVAAGYIRSGSNYDLALARYNTNGSLDTSFNGTGQVTCPTGSTSSFTPGMAIQNDGKILIAGWFTLARYNSDGSLDTAFNSTGKVTTPYFGRSLVVQNDGKIVLAGYFTVSGSNDFAVVRYNANGTLDTSFNTTGKVTTAIGSGADIGSKVVLQSDGKILVTGYTTLAVASDRAVATVRYNSNGSLDTSFNSTGIVTTDFAGGADEGNDVAVQSDGKVVVAGFGDTGRHILLMRYNSNGSLDTSFNGTGKLTTTGNSSTGYGVALQNDGKILVAGGSGNLFALVRCNANGSMDTSFNDTGIVTTDIGIGNDIGTGVALQSDGKIVLVGQVSNGSNYDFGLARYLAAADPDITVEQPLNTSIASGSSKFFGNLDVGTNVSLTFTIKNTGGADLTGLTITKDGADAAMFTLTASPTAPVSQNNSTSFTVRFAPTSVGAKTAALHIASNVAAKSPFEITLTGSGNTPSESWRQQFFGTVANSGNAADTATPKHDGVPNLMKFATGMNPAQSGRMPGSATKNGGNIIFTYPRSKTALSSGVTYTVEWSDTLAADSWSSVGVTESSVVDQGSTEEVSASVSAGANGRRFVRLKVTAAP